MAKDGVEKGGKRSSMSDRQVRAHVVRVLKQLLPKGGEKKKDAGDRRGRLHMVARVVAIGDAKHPMVGGT